MKGWKSFAIASAISLSAVASASAQGFGGIGYAATPPGLGYAATPPGLGYSAGYNPALSISGYSGGYGGGLSVGGYSGSGFNFSYGGLPQYYVQPQWAQPHWDYHPGSVRRHGNHYHVTPGHYDLHVPGHHPHHHH